MIGLYQRTTDNKNSIGNYFVGAKVNGIREVLSKTNINMRFFKSYYFHIIKN